MPIARPMTVSTDTTRDGCCLRPSSTLRTFWANPWQEDRQAYVCSHESIPGSPFEDHPPRTPARRSRQAACKHRSQIESLESRQLLTVSGTVPSILGTVFVDTNQNTTLDSGEAVAGATVRLFEDDGDGVFETNGDDVQFGPDLVTDAPDSIASPASRPAIRTSYCSPLKRSAPCRSLNKSRP